MKGEGGRDELVEAIADATRKAVCALFRDRPGSYYYCALITTGQGHPPQLSAWSLEALHDAASGQPDPTRARSELKWSYADSPFCGFGEEHFGEVRAILEARPRLDPNAPAEKWIAELAYRLGAMEAAMAKLNAEGVFGTGEKRARLVINVEVVLPDSSNTERALRLNPPEALREWLNEAAEV